MRPFHSLRTSIPVKPLGWTLSLLLSLGLTVGYGTGLRAQEAAATAPAAVKTLLSQIDAAANQHHLEEVMAFYSSQFQNSDGLTYQSLQQALAKLWERYPNLQYKTALQSWQQEGDTLIIQAVTEITGTGKVQDRELQLQAKIESRQHWQGQKLVQQEILKEQTQVTSGSKPPQVTVSVPETVRVGETFDFDAIVQEPLGDDLLLGAAVEEKIDGNRYLEPSTLDLELLQAGGIFKRAKAPALPGASWLSAVLVRGDGMTLITRRVNVEK